MSLTAAERETVVTGCDADDHITIWTAQRPIITKLKKNDAAELLEEGVHEGSVWAKFKLDAGLLSFRSGKRKVSPEQREAARARMVALHQEGGLR
jgi:hypothetical protein